MTRGIRTALVAVPALAAATLLPLLGVQSAQATATAAQGSTRAIFKAGTTAYRPAPRGTGAYTSPSAEVARQRGPDGNAVVNRSFGRMARGTAAAASATAAAAATPSAVTPTGARVVRSFPGLNAADQRTANGGNQFSVEPPDQALCVGGGHVVEATNDVFRVYGSKGGGQTGVQDLNSFYGYPAQYNRTTGRQGPFVTDPTCLFDPTTGKFFLTVLTLDVVPTTGAFTGNNHLDIAVSGNPTGKWDIYRLNVTDDGTHGTPVHPHCPCIGDYPHIGVDAHGFYVTTNEYSFFGPQFNSAQIYAFSKRQLANGAKTVYVTHFDTTGADKGKPGFTVWPAQSPSTGQYDNQRNGTEYFMSSNATEETGGKYVSQSIVTWALTGSATLGNARPKLALRNSRVAVRTYSLPPAANQKSGPTPLKACLNSDPCAKLLLGAPDKFHETEGPLDSNDTRMQQVTYARGKLYGALDTAVRVGGTVRAGIAYYVVAPSPMGAGKLLMQGRVGLAGNNVTYPTIGITSGGQGIMAFTLVGNDFYPTAAFTGFDAVHGAGPIKVAAMGQGPQDGFSEYKAFGNPPRPRWGDYGATAVDGSTIWAAAEYIGQSCTLKQYEAQPFGTCGGSRVPFINWATRVSQIRP